MNVFRSFGADIESDSVMVQDAVLGQMNFAFIDMGQGDCTIISCPDNRVYIVDCGSNGGLESVPFNQACEVVRAWANGGGVWMIITHPDKDHYNKFIDLLGSEPPVGVSTIFFSDAYKDTSPLGNYKASALNRNLPILSNPLLIEVTLNNTTNRITKWTNLEDYAVAFPENLDTNNYVVHSGVEGEKHWSLTIIAGNIQSTSRIPSVRKNAVSLCTLAAFGAEKLLLTGDSTDETLSYLYNHHRDQITNVSFFQVPHHGSAGSTPTNNFKNTVDPESILVSVGLLEDNNNLPRYSVLNSWSTVSRLKNTSRVMDYWKTREDVHGYDDHAALQNIKNVTWRPYEVLSNDSGSFFWLKDPSDAGPDKSNTGFYGFTNDGYFLFRATENKDIYETGILGSREAGFE